MIYIYICIYIYINIPYICMFFFHDFSPILSLHGRLPGQYPEVVTFVNAHAARPARAHLTSGAVRSQSGNFP